NRRLGAEITVEEMSDIFRKLRFDYDVTGDDFTVTVPSRRGDVVIFEDMLEEIARIYGYDLLPYTLPQNASQLGELTYEQKMKRHVKNYMQSVGMSEAITYSLTNKKAGTMLVS